MTRAERRHHRQRVVEYAKRKLKQWGVPVDTGAPQKHADNMAKCSCWMCNGRAKWTKPKTLANWMNEDEYND